MLLRWSSSLCLGELGSYRGTAAGEGPPCGTRTLCQGPPQSSSLGRPVSAAPTNSEEVGPNSKEGTGRSSSASAGIPFVEECVAKRSYSCLAHVEGDGLQAQVLPLPPQQDAGAAQLTAAAAPPAAGCPEQHVVGVPHNSDEKPCTTELLEELVQARVSEPQRGRSFRAAEAKTEALDGAAIRSCPLSLPVSGKHSRRARRASPLPSSSPMPFDSDFLLGLKQQAGCSSPAEGPASQSALLPALLGKREWRSHSCRDSTGDIAFQIAQQASSCRTSGNRPRSFKGLPSFLHGSKGRDLWAGMDTDAGLQPSSQGVAEVLESMFSREAGFLAAQRC
mmetsp:Transcript_24560/g.66975  ORF Transcript_24560/g.66975 Transcript_24560/m.66975 type:complete len:335 (-) Transcript_24560:1935-2939(-)